MALPKAHTFDTTNSGHSELHLQAAKEELQLPIKALNPDNCFEIEQLVTLFEHTCTSSHPSEELLQHDFWEEELRGDTVSVVAEDQGKYVAHLALRIPHQSSYCEVLWPAVHEKYKNHISAITRGLKEFVEPFAKRRNCKMLYHYCCNANPLLQVLARHCFSGTEIALLPISPDEIYEDLNPREKENFSNGLVIFCSPLSPLMKKTVHVPEKHQAIVERLFSNVSLDSEEIEQLTAQEANPSKKNKTSISLRYRLSFVELSVNTREVLSCEDFAKFAAKFSQSMRKQKKLTLVRLPLSDSECPKFCSALEENNFKFCGILPHVDDEHYILYTRLNLNERMSQTDVFSEEAKFLRQYLSSL